MYSNSHMRYCYHIMEMVRQAPDADKTLHMKSVFSHITTSISRNPLAVFFGRQRCIFDCHLYISTRLKLAIYLTTYSELTKPIYLHHVYTFKRVDNQTQLYFHTSRVELMQNSTNRQHTTMLVQPTYMFLFSLSFVAFKQS